tara:strand:- start:4 stop:528 length:525 start_codon:yes stop_codon:yes gene_type:complete
MEAYPLYDYIQITKSSSEGTSVEEAKGIYTFQIPNGFYTSNQRSSVATVEAVVGSVDIDHTQATIDTLNVGLVNPTPSNANTTNNDTTAPPTLISFDNVGMNSGRQAQYQTENPAYQIPARPSSLKIKFFEDGLGTNQSNMGAIIADFVITLKFVYYDPIKTTLNLGNQYTPTI